MAQLVDTCGWIEWLTDGPLADHFGPSLTNSEELIIPTCLQFELYKWVKRELNETRAIEVIALTEQGQVRPLTTALSLYAADLSLQYKLSFADALIYATARQEDAELVTADAHFKGLPGVVLFAK